MHLAELNIAKLKYDLDDPRVSDFANNIARVNALAERSEGFVWRLEDESGDATSIKAFEDPRVIVNMSVWQTPEAFEKFVWATIHKQFYARREEWFSGLENMNFAMWWVEEGHEPDTEEARERLEHLRINGPSDYAFGWESLPNLKMWKQARCA